MEVDELNQMAELAGVFLEQLTIQDLVTVGSNQFGFIL
jgi:hypothetical protein